MIRAEVVQCRRSLARAFLHSIAEPRLNNLQSRDFELPDLGIDRTGAPISNENLARYFFIGTFFRILRRVRRYPFDAFGQPSWHFITALLSTKSVGVGMVDCPDVALLRRIPSREQLIFWLVRACTCIALQRPLLVIAVPLSRPVRMSNLPACSAMICSCAPCHSVEVIGLSCR
jgi:hypothetical protein